MNAYKKTLINFLRNDTPIHLQFKGLNLDPTEFITLEQLFELERHENYQKTLALRDISNEIIKKDSFIDEIHYSELKGPKLKLLFDSYAANNYALQEMSVGKNNDKKYCYTITPEIIDYLFEGRNLSSKLDIMLVQKFKDELLYFKECLENGTFYPSYTLVDATANFKIFVTHDNFQTNRINDSINLEEYGSGMITCEYINNGVDCFIYEYNPNIESRNCSTTYFGIPNTTQFPKILSIHKKKLPTVIQEKIK